MANPTGNQHEGNSAPETTASSTDVALKSSSGILLTWTAEEQALLEQGLVRFASEPNLKRCMRIALQLPNKTVREVALRIQWMNKKENNKRRKDDHHLTRKSKDKKEKISDPAAKPSHFSAQPNVSPYAPAMVVMDIDDGISYQAIGGPTGELLEQNAKALNQISANLAAGKLQDNIKLFCQARDNINKILNDLKDVPEVMKQMPRLPFKINEALANSILPKAPPPMQ